MNDSSWRQTVPIVIGLAACHRMIHVAFGIAMREMCANWFQDVSIGQAYAGVDLSGPPCFILNTNMKP
jgi:hypothetical protein